MSEQGTDERSTNDTPSQGDTLLWLGGALVVGMGVVWLVLAKPWADGSDRQPAASSPSATVTVDAVPSSGAARAEVASSLEDNPLRMADLAYEAGMLVEPEDYSAWALYRRALDRDPDSVEAKAGLDRIADELLRRANAALEQGRFADVRETIDRIRSAMPVHPGANDLEMRLEQLTPRVAALRVDGPVINAPSTTRPEPPGRQASASGDSAPAEDVAGAEGDPEPPASSMASADAGARGAAAAETDEVAAEDLPAEPPVDPLEAPYLAFTEAMAQNRLLTPAAASAKYYVSALTAIDREDARTEQARRTLFDALMSRGDRAMRAMDHEAAETWFNEAQAIGLDTAAVASALTALKRERIRIEAARRVPVSSLSIVEYTPPEFPIRALERGTSGWVDVEFTVDTLGRPQAVEIVDSSHAQLFRQEAVSAVQKWRFEPRVFLGELIEQRGYSRIRFQVE